MFLDPDGGCPLFLRCQPFGGILVLFKYQFRRSRSNAGQTGFDGLEPFHFFKARGESDSIICAARALGQMRESVSHLRVGSPVHDSIGGVTEKFRYLRGIAQVKIVWRRVRYDSERPLRTSSALALRFGPLLLRLGVVEKSNDRQRLPWEFRLWQVFISTYVSVKTRAFGELQRPLDAVS